MKTLKEHWDQIYQTKPLSELSWTQPAPITSLNLIRATGLKSEARVIDVGGGLSTLVDHLLGLGFLHQTVADISKVALLKSKERLGKRALDVTWLEGDITEIELPRTFYDLWHDRAVFHFLTDAQKKLAYLNNLFSSMKPGGFIILSTFSTDGPEKCSGLPVIRYDEKSFGETFGPQFVLKEVFREIHQTPWGKPQAFITFLAQLK